MFRPRRPFRRPPVARIPPAVPPALSEAESLMKAGKFAGAAERFELLGHEAEARGRLVMGANLYLQAARCRVELNDVARADELAERAVELLVQARDWPRVRQVVPRVLAALERQGRREDAERLRQRLATTFQGSEMPGVRPAAQARMAARLPAKCSNCGGPVLPDEVFWAGPATAECPYCGGVIKAAL